MLLYRRPWLARRNAERTTEITASYLICSRSNARDLADVRYLYLQLIWLTDGACVAYSVHTLILECKKYKNLHQLSFFPRTPSASVLPLNPASVAFGWLTAPLSGWGGLQPSNVFSHSRPFYVWFCPLFCDFFCSRKLTINKSLC